MKVSVITPTFSRGPYLPGLYDLFRQQTWADLELLICDDSAEPSKYMQKIAAQDGRVRYWHSSKRLHLADKRNLLIARAQGEIIAQFDDDDYYAPNYIKSMLGYLGSADLLSLGAWFSLQLPGGQFYYWDTTCCAPRHFLLSGGEVHILATQDWSYFQKRIFIFNNLGNWGFSFVFRKRAHDARAKFPRVAHGEDREFVLALHRSGRKVVHVLDREGLALHIQHGGNMSRFFPQYRLPGCVGHKLFPGLRRFLRRDAPEVQPPAAAQEEAP